MSTEEGQGERLHFLFIHEDVLGPTQTHGYLFPPSCILSPGCLLTPRC